MKKFFNIAILLLTITCFSACNYFTYTPRSRYKKQHEMAPLPLLYKIVEFREEFNEWPFTKEYFILKGGKYRDAFAGFKYLYTEFKIIDNNEMIFTFSGHIKDVENYKVNNKIDLNSYGGSIKFYKDGDRFTWKEMRGNKDK